MADAGNAPVSALTFPARDATLPPHMQSVHVRRMALLSLLLAASGCYESHGRGADASIDVRGSDTPLVDAARDTGRVVVRDAGRDAPRRDVPGGGGPCQRDADCMAGLCVLDVDRAAVDEAPVPLICGGAGFTPPGRECEANDECENGLCTVSGGCVEPCVDDADCAPSERCTTAYVVTSARAMQTARACARWVDAPEGVEVAANEDLAVRAFRTERFDVPRAAHDHRVILHVSEYSDARTIDRVALTGSRTLYDLSLLGTPQINPAVGYFDLAPILLPIAPWPAALDRRGAVDYDITTGAERSHHRVVLSWDDAGRTLDLNVYFVGIRPTATNRGMLERMLEDFSRILSGMGLRVGRTRQLEMVGAAAMRFAVIDDYAEMSELFRTSAGAARPALNVFLIATSAEFLGVAGGIPGALAMHGAGSSGIALSFEDLRDAFEVFGPEFLGVVIAHEVGHFSGLFHSTETDGSSFSPLDDVPVCDISHDVDGDGMVFAEECVGAGGDNIMFWGPTLSGATFSPMQRELLTSNPMLLP